MKLRLDLKKQKRSVAKFIYTRWMLCSSLPAVNAYPRSGDMVHETRSHWLFFLFSFCRVTWNCLLSPNGMTPSLAPMLKCPNHFLKGKERELFARSSYAAHLGLETWWLFSFPCVVLCVRLEKWRKLLQLRRWERERETDDR